MNPIKKAYRWTQTSARNALAALGMSGLAAFLGLSLMIGAASAAPLPAAATTTDGATTQTTQSAPRTGGFGWGPVIFLPSWGWGWNAPRVPAPAPVEAPANRPAPNTGQSSAPVGGGSSDSRSWSGPSNTKPSQAAPSNSGGSDMRSWGGGTTRSAPAPRPSLPKIRGRR